MRLNAYIALCAALVLSACSDPAPQVPNNKIERTPASDCLMEMNREFAAIEDSLIRAYVDSLHLNVTTTPSGLRYYITNAGTGEKAGATDDVTYRYTVSQLDGTKCDKVTDVVRTVNLEKGELDRGFREALKILSVSESGVFLMPSFLAYGVIGVPNCIPPWTPVVCEITLIEKKCR